MIWWTLRVKTHTLDDIINYEHSKSIFETAFEFISYEKTKKLSMQFLFELSLAQPVVSFTQFVIRLIVLSTFAVFTALKKR